MSDFFEDIERKSAAMKAARQAQNDLRSANATFVRDVLPDVADFFRSYEQRLKALGFNVSVAVHEEQLFFTLKFADGEGTAVRIGRDAEYGFLTYEETSLGAYGAMRAQQGTVMFERSNWSIGVLESRVQAMISGFTDDAPGHGGL